VTSDDNRTQARTGLNRPRDSQYIAIPSGQDAYIGWYTILKNLSLYTESRSASILEMKIRLDTTFQMLTSFKTVDGLSLSAFNNGVDASGSYCGIHVGLSRTKADGTSFDVMRCQFLQAVDDNTKVRFPDQQLSCSWCSFEPVRLAYSDENQLAVYGESDVITLARLLQVDR